MGPNGTDHDNNRIRYGWPRQHKRPDVALVEPENRVWVLTGGPMRIFAGRSSGLARPGISVHGPPVWKPNPIRRPISPVSTVHAGASRDAEVAADVRIDPDDIVPCERHVARPRACSPDTPYIWEL